MAGRDPLAGPEPLETSHTVDGFDCGIVALNDYLASQAFADQRAGKSRTYVVARSGRVVAYFSLAAVSITPDEATERAAKGQGAQGIPAILLARFAVDLSEQGRGVGRAMLVDALARARGPPASSASVSSWCMPRRTLPGASTSSTASRLRP